MGMFAPLPDARSRTCGRWLASALALAALLFPALALAQVCSINADATQFQVGDPGETLNFTFDVAPDTLGSCAQNGTLALSDSSGGAVLNGPATWSSAAGQVAFSVTLGPQPGGSVQILIDCTDCTGANTQLSYFGDVRNQVSLQLVDPADGLLQATPGATVNLSVQLIINGAPANSGEDSVCWQITSNPAGDAVLGPGDYVCGGLAKGFVSGSSIGTFIPSGANGIATIPLAVGSANTSPVQVLVFSEMDPAAVTAIQVATTPTLEAVSPATIETATTAPFQVQVRTVDIGGAPAAGHAISFTAVPPLTPASGSASTDANGIAVATFTANQEGNFPDAVTATYDPTPASPGSGDEQSLAFAVAALDVVAIAKPATGSGDGQSAAPGEAFAAPLVAEVTRNGAAAPGEVVNWEVVSGSAVLATSTSVTDNTGRASVGVDAGALAGPVQVRASLSGVPGQEAFYALDVVSTKTLRKPSTGSGDRQSGSPGATLQPLAVLAFDDGLAAAGVTINWSVVEGDAQLGSSQSVTDASGRAEVAVTLGAATGPVRVQAARADEPTAVETFVLNTVDVEQLAVVSGQAQQPQAGTEGEPLVVRFTRNNQPVAGVPVAWEVLSGDATVDPASAATDGQGLSSVAIAFGDQGGQVVVEASAGSAAPVQYRFDVGGGSGPPPQGISMELVSGDNQDGPIGTRSDQPLVVLVRDGDGNPLEGIPVGWRVLSGNATLDGSEVLTDAQGRASMGVRLGDAPGAIVVRASAFTDLAFADFDLFAFAPTLARVSGDGQQAPAGQPLPEEFVVAIAVPAAKALADVVVTWTVLEGGGSLAAATTTTDAEGRSANHLTLGPDAGSNRVRAEIPGGGMVEFTATALGGGSLVKLSGDGQSLPTETLSEPLVVELRDAAGAPIVGATLLWSGDNADLEAETTATDANGRSSNRARILLPGAAVVSVQPRDIEADAVAFSLNGGVVNTAGLGTAEREVAEAIDELCPALASIPQRTPQQQDLLDRCMELIDNAGDDPAGVADALEEMLQDVALTQVQAALLTTLTQFDNLKARIAAIRSGARGFDLAGLNVNASGGMLPMALLQDEDEGAEVGADFGRWGFFASGTIGRGDVEAGATAPEYDFDTAGLTAGVDYRISDRWILGAALGYAQQDTELAGDAGKVDTTGWSVSAYSTWYRDDSWYLDAVLTWGSNDYDLERRIRYSLQRTDGSTSAIDQLARASSDGTQLSSAVSFGRDFQRGAWNFGPYFRGTWARVDFDGYVEQLRDDLPGSGLGLAVDGRDVDSMTAVLGGRLTYTASRDWGILMPHVSLEWEHEFQDDPQTLVMRFLHDPTGTPIAISGEPLDTDYYNLGIGLSALFPGGKSGFLYYEQLLGASGIDQANLAIGVRFEF